MKRLIEQGGDTDRDVAHAAKLLVAIDASPPLSQSAARVPASIESGTRARPSHRPGRLRPAFVAITLVALGSAALVAVWAARRWSSPAPASTSASPTTSPNITSDHEITIGAPAPIAAPMPGPRAVTDGSAPHGAPSLVADSPGAPSTRAARGQRAATPQKLRSTGRVTAATTRISSRRPRARLPGDRPSSPSSRATRARSRPTCPPVSRATSEDACD